MYKYKEGTRIIPNNPSTVKPEVKKESNGVNGAAASKANFPLKGATFVLDDSIKGKTMIASYISNNNDWASECDFQLL